MGKQTLLDKVKSAYWGFMCGLMNYTLKHFGYDFGPFYMDVIDTMYRDKFVATDNIKIGASPLNPQDREETK